MTKKILAILIIIILLAIQSHDAIAQTLETLEGRRITIEDEILERNLQIEALQERITDEPSLNSCRPVLARHRSHRHQPGVWTAYYEPWNA